MAYSVYVHSIFYSIIIITDNNYYIQHAVICKFAIIYASYIYIYHIFYRILSHHGCNFSTVAVSALDHRIREFPEAKRTKTLERGREGPTRGSYFLHHFGGVDKSVPKHQPSEILVWNLTSEKVHVSTPAGHAQNFKNWLQWIRMGLLAPPAKWSTKRSTHLKLWHVYRGYFGSSTLLHLCVWECTTGLTHRHSSANTSYTLSCSRCETTANSPSWVTILRRMGLSKMDWNGIPKWFI